MESEYENKMTNQELLNSVGAANPTSAPDDLINAITKSTIPDVTEKELETVKEIVPEEIKITEGEVFKPSEQLLEWLSTTGERKAQPIRNAASAFFNINSIDRYASFINTTAQFALITEPYQQLAGTPASSYNMNLGRNLMSGYFYRLTVTDVNIQWNIPTICSQNYLLTVGIFIIPTIDTGFAVVNIPFGYYSFDELASVLQAQIRYVFNGTPYAVPNLTVTWKQQAGTAGNGFVFETNDVTALITFSSTFPPGYTGSPRVGFPNEATILSGTGLNNALRAMYKLYTMLGITNVLISSFSVYSATTPSYPTLIYTSYVDVISNKLSQFMRVKDSETAWSPDTSVITRIYLTNQGTITSPQIVYTNISGSPPAQQVEFNEFAVGSRPFILNYTPQTPKNIKWSPDQAIVDFDIRVVDEFGDILPWSLRTIGNQLANQVIAQEFFEFQLTVLCSET